MENLWPFLGYFILVVSFGGALGGFMQALRSTDSYKVSLPHIIVTPKEASSTQLSTTSHKKYQWDTGFLGFLVAGIIAAFLSIGLISMTRTVDFHPIIHSALEASNQSEKLSLPPELYVDAHKSHSEEINKILNLYITQKLQNGSKEQALDNQAFWAWLKLFTVAIIGGFGGVSLISLAYERYVQRAELDEVKAEVQLENTRSRVDILLVRAREYFEHDQFEDALALCDQALNLDAKNVRAFGFKAQCLRGLKRYPEALDALDQILSIPGVPATMLSKVYWNKACYLNLQTFGTNGPVSESITDKQLKALRNIKLFLENSITYAPDQITQRSKLEEDEHIKGLDKLRAFDIQWFEELKLPR